MLLMPAGEGKGRVEEIKLEYDKVERAFIVGVQQDPATSAEAADQMAELGSLAVTMGVSVVGETLTRVTRPAPHFYLGSGKAEEIKQLALAEEADVLIFDLDLSPSQQRNWEEFTGIAVIDRQEVILDICAGRAQTKEARLQVGLARMEYSLPRLRRAWSHLERQRGGAGLRGGPGELQLEVDRRVVTDRIARFRRELKEVRQQRAVQRRARGHRPVPVAAIVGYTNVGKSSLLRALTGAEVLVEDKLFATLDTTTRRIMLPNNQPLLLTDTVGFIRKLPHGLVEAFKATLEEAALADFLVHVLDITHPNIEEQYRVTNEVLEELGAGNKKTLLVLNKADEPHDPFRFAEFRARNPLCLQISAHSGAGMRELLDAFAANFTLPMRRLTLRLPHARFDLIDLLHREGTVHSEKHDERGVAMEADVPERYARQLEAFASTENAGAAAE